MKNILFLFLFLISESTFAQIDTLIGREVSKKDDDNVSKLAHALCDDISNDSLKVNAIYNWVTCNIAYDAKSYNKTKFRDEPPKKVLSRRKAICGGYADLVTAMCKEVGIEAISIDGYFKDWLFDDGDKFFKPNHAWNAVRINNQWYFLDATAGAGHLTLAPSGLKKILSKINKKKLYTAKKNSFVRSYDTSYFMPDVEMFKESHLPADPIWQLSDTSLPMHTFESGIDSIIYFNTNISKPQLNSAQIYKIERLDEDEKTLECAERIYQFNTRYTTKLAEKKYLEGIENLTNALNQDSKSEGIQYFDDFKNDLNVTKTIIQTQKKAITEEIVVLKRKNKDKNESFKQFYKELNQENKKRKSQIRTFEKQAETKIAGLNRSRNTLKTKKVPYAVADISDIKTGIELDKTNLSLKLLEDSIQRRNLRLVESKKSFLARQTNIEVLIQSNKESLDEVAELFPESDSVMTKETKARLSMKDDYDKEVKEPHAMIETIRLTTIKTDLDLYMDNSNLIKKNYDTLLLDLTDQERMIRASLKDIEQYKRQNSSNQTVLSKYAIWIAEAEENKEKQNDIMIEYAQFLSKAKEVQKVINGIKEREDYLMKYMKMGEDKRKELEDKKIAKDEKWLKKENENSNQLLKSTEKKADHLFHIRYDSTSKKWIKELKKLEKSVKEDS